MRKWYEMRILYNARPPSIVLTHCSEVSITCNYSNYYMESVPIIPKFFFLMGLPTKNLHKWRNMRSFGVPWAVGLDTAIADCLIFRRRHEQFPCDSSFRIDRKKSSKNQKHSQSFRAFGPILSFLSIEANSVFSSSTEEYEISYS